MIPYKDGRSLAYNAGTNNLAIMEVNEYKAYEKLEKEGIEIEDAELKERLIEGGFIYQDDINELDVIRLKMNQARNNSQTLGLTIAPTSDCNFRCVYCFEKNVIQPIYMSEETENHIIEYIRSKMPEIKRLNIAWYGGEPLLGYESIRRISKAVLEMCEEYGVQYTANIITNGYLLNEERIKELVSWNVEQYQITIDGGCEMHNKRRALRSGKGSYDEILNNLKMLAAYEDVSISVRVNVDKENVHEIENILEMVSNLSENDNIVCYPGHVEAIEGCYKEEDCLNNEEYSQLSDEFNQTLKKKNMIPIFNKEYPRMQYGGCAATRMGSLIINADGKLYKCWNEIGDESHCVGKISNPSWQEKYRAEYMKYMSYDPTRDKTCMECKFLPLCMGGCPFKRVNHKERCYVKDFTDIEKMMIQVSENLLEQEENNESILVR